MAITSTTSGAWGTGATWVGGTKPTTDDDVVIAAGHSVQVDEQTAVLNSLLIQSHTSAPGIVINHLFEGID